MAKKSDAAEIDRRIHTVVKLLSSAKTSCYVVRFCSEEWGVTERQGHTYLARALSLWAESNTKPFGEKQGAQVSPSIS